MAQKWSSKIFLPWTFSSTLDLNRDDFNLQLLYLNPSFCHTLTHGAFQSSTFVTYMSMFAFDLSRLNEMNIFTFSVRLSLHLSIRCHLLVHLKLAIVLVFLYLVYEYLVFLYLVYLYLVYLYLVYLYLVYLYLVYRCLVYLYLINLGILSLSILSLSIRHLSIILSLSMLSFSILRLSTILFSWMLKERKKWNEW